MDLTTYKLLHIVGSLFVFQGLGTALVVRAQEVDGGWRRLSIIAHGIGLLLILVAGFGMMARLGLTGGFPIWIWIKLGIWIVVGSIPFVLRKKPEWTKMAWWGAIVLGLIAAYLALFKPLV